MSIEAEKQEPVGQLQEVAFGRGQVMWFKKPEDETMLYTHPPKREWVGLEASEYVAFYNQFANYQEENPEDSGWWAFANAIEQALKEKNT